MPPRRHIPIKFRIEGCLTLLCCREEANEGETAVTRKRKTLHRRTATSRSIYLRANSSSSSEMRISFTATGVPQYSACARRGINRQISRGMADQQTPRLPLPAGSCLCISSSTNNNLVDGTKVASSYFFAEFQVIEVQLPLVILRQPVVSHGLSDGVTTK